MRVTVLGAGSWGTTLASLVSARNETMLWAREPEIADAVSHHRENPLFLPGFAISPGLRATTDLETALRDAEVILVAVPSRYFRSVVEAARPFVPGDVDLVTVTMGIEPGTCRRMTEVLDEALARDPSRVCVCCRAPISPARSWPASRLRPLSRAVTSRGRSDSNSC
jgi:glycerol-3-phosphate dehydrogenase (NAD(P)+)